MNKHILIGLLLVSCSAISFAQTGTIRGSVFDANTGDPLIGVTVVVDGTDQGTVTDIDGKFKCL